MHEQVQILVEHYNKNETNSIVGYNYNPRAAGGGHKVAPPLRFVKYLRNLMSYERETWHSFK